MALTADQIAKRSERIRRLRAEGLNIAQISGVTGYSRRYISRVLSGREPAAQRKQEWTGVLARTLNLTSAEVDRLSKRTGRFTGSSRMPDVNGFYVYFLVGNDDVVWYIGKSSNLYARRGDHMSDPEKRKIVHHVEFFRCESEEHMDRVERILIETFGPVRNIIYNKAERPPSQSVDPREG